MYLIESQVKVLSLPESERILKHPSQILLRCFAEMTKTTGLGEVRMVSPARNLTTLPRILATITLSAASNVGKVTKMKVQKFADLARESFRFKY